MKPGNKTNALLGEALKNHATSFRKVIFFSFFINLLVMAPTVYMLEVYDRVVNSRTVATLIMLTGLIVFAYVILEALEWIRTQMLSEIANNFDARVRSTVFRTLFEANLRRIPGGNHQALQDLKTVREFISSPAAMAIIDVPLAMLYIIAIFLINSVMGWMAIVGALCVVTLAWLTERGTGRPLKAANAAAVAAQSYANNSLHNAQVIEAMGMEKGIHRRWLERQKEMLKQQADASDKAGNYSALSKFVQQTQASLLLGAGCFLTIAGMFPGGGGMMIVASTLGGRLLSPIVQVIAAWKQIAAARDSFLRLQSLLKSVPLREAGMPLPAPAGALAVESVTAAPPGSNNLVLRNVSFKAPSGRALALIGPSASGKSTLARLLVGVWPATSGKVRLDGVDIYPWNKLELGPHIGYLPQEVNLFNGSLAENIARFGSVDMGKVEAVAKAVGIHDMILNLPEGYDSNIGEDGCVLSGGQRQRVGLARALYNSPQLIVLDEPNSSLDEAGELALARTITEEKRRGATIIVITHRTSILAVVDDLLILHEGEVKAHGPRDEILAALQRNAQQSPTPTNTGIIAPAA